MPWKAKLVDDKWCSINAETNKTVSCFGDDKSKAEAHVKALFANTKENLSGKDDVGMALLRVAYTNEPHLRLRKHPLSIVKVGEEEYIRHPIIVAGKYSHPKGKLDLNSVPIEDPRHKFNRIIANHYGDVTDAGVYTRPGHESREAWSWLSPEHGGWLAVESVGKDILLVGYGKATSKDRLETLRRGDYRYISADLHTKYKSNALESDGDVVQTHQLTEEDMSDKETKTISLDEFKAFTKAQEEAKKLAGQVKSLETGKGEMETKMARLEARLEEFESDNSDNDSDLPEPVRLKLEQQSKQMANLEASLAKAERGAVLGQLKQAMKMASTPDKNGGIVDSFTLEAIKDFALGKPFELDGEEIALEENATSTLTQYHSIKFLVYLLENTPRHLSGEASSEAQEQRLSEDGAQATFTEEELKDVDAAIDDAWGKSGTWEAK